MSQQTVIWLTIGVYVVFMLAVGLLSRRRAEDITKFTVGGRSAGAWVSALSYGTAYFSAVMFIGYAGKTGWNFGLWHRHLCVSAALFRFGVQRAVQRLLGAAAGGRILV